MASRISAAITVALVPLLLCATGISLSSGGNSQSRVDPHATEPISTSRMSAPASNTFADRSFPDLSRGAEGPDSPQFVWSQARPPPRGNLSGAGLAADPSREEAVLFGGANGTELLNQTWTYSEANNSWTTISTPTAPGPRSDFGFAADPATQIAVLFGGVINAVGEQPDADTWVFNFSDGAWTNVTQSVAPPARQDPGFAVDPSLGEALLYGGWNRNLSGSGALIYSDTWILNLTSFAWSHLSTAGSEQPPPLEGAGLSWDPVLGQFEMFGGCFPCGSSVWRFTPTTGATGLWSQAATAGTVPPSRASPVWAYDPMQQQDVLFGGIGNGGPLNDTYTWNPATGNWTAVRSESHPTGRSSAAAAWMAVPTNETLLLTEGARSSPTADLWRFAPSANLSVRVFNRTSGLPVANASVSLDGGSPGLTDVLGFRNLSSVAPVEHTVSSIAPGYAPTNVSLWVDPGLTVHLDVNLTPIPAADLTVQVLDLNGNPIANAQVAVRIQGVLFRNPPLQTNASGYVSYTNIPTFPANVTASAVYFHNGSQTVDLVSGQTAFLQLHLTPFPVAWVHVLGFLTPLGLSEPLYHAVVDVDPQSMGFTGLSGDAFVQLDVDGGIVISIAAQGFSPDEIVAQAPFTGTFRVNATLTSLPFGTVDVLVLVAGTHEPIAGAAVNFTAVAGSPLNLFQLNGVSGAQGYSNSSYPPTNYSVTVEHSGFETNSSIPVINVLPSSRQEITVNLTPLPVISVPGQNGSFYLIPPGHPVAWVFLIVPLLLLLAGGTYLGLTKGEPNRPRAARPSSRPPKPPPPPQARIPPRPPPSDGG